MKLVRNIVVKAIILISIGLFCLPAVSHIINAHKAWRVSGDDVSLADSFDEEEYDNLIKQAVKYNDSLPVGEPPRYLTDKETEQYMSLMNIAGTGVMGRISIPKINVDLAIYHGDTDEILQVAAGHMAGSSLPVVSSSSHVVISAHSGLTSAPLFTDLSMLDIGDTFSITALRQTLTYEVDQILTVWPKETDTIVIETGKEYCTLVTCTPLGVNNRRLLVRGHRIAVTKDENALQNKTSFIKELLGGKILAFYEVALLLVALILFIAAFIWPLIKAKTKKFGKNQE